jgi:hypothetical protein
MKRLVFAAALLLASGAAQASQNSLVGGNFPTVSPYPGLTLVENINSAMEAINSMNSGASAPSYEVQGTMFANTSSGIEEFYSGSNWLFTGSYTGSAYVPISNGVPLGNCPTSGGSSNAYTVTYSPAPSAWAVGQPYCFYTNFSNTSSATVNPNGLGAKPLTKNGTTNLANGDLGSSVEVQCIYDGTNCEIVSQLSTVFSPAGAWSVLANSTGSSAVPSFTSTPSVQALYLSTTQATSSGKNGLISTLTNSVSIEVNGNDALHMTATGSGGIGTTTPDQKLTVAGAIHSTTSGFEYPDGTLQTTAGNCVPASGYCVLPGGWIHEAGVVGSLASGSSATVALPFSCPTAMISATVSLSGGPAVANLSASVVSTSNTQIVVANDSSGTQAVFWEVDCY